MYSHVDLIAEYQRKINLQDNIKIFITFMLIESHLKINFNVQFPFLNFMSMLNSLTKCVAIFFLHFHISYRFDTCHCSVNEYEQCSNF